MKTNFLKTLVLATIVAIANVPSKLSAQINTIPYDIINGTSCSIVVDYQIISSNNGPCGWVTNNTIPNGSSLSIPSSAFSNCGNAPYDVQTTIQQYDGQPVSNPATVDMSNTFFNWGPCAPGVSTACCAGAIFKINWTPGFTTIK